MPRRKKDARILYIKLDRQLYELLEGQAEATGDTKTGLVEKILSAYLQKGRRTRLRPSSAGRGNEIKKD